MLDVVKVPDPALTKLWHATSAIGNTLRKFARPLNNAFAMASQVVHMPKLAPGRNGWNPSLVIQGKLHHFMGPLFPAEGKPTAFAQTYMHDPSMANTTALDLRMANSSSSSESDAGVHAASCVSSDSESLLEQALRAAGPVDPATGLSMEQTYLQFGGGRTLRTIVAAC